MAGKGVVEGPTHIEDFQIFQHVSIIRLVSGPLGVFNTLTATTKTKKSNYKKDRGYFISPNPEQQLIKAIFDSPALSLSMFFPRSCRETSWTLSLSKITHTRSQIR